jgi:hypothetical protein
MERQNVENEFSGGGGRGIVSLKPTKAKVTKPYLKKKQNQKCWIHSSSVRVLA